MVDSRGKAVNPLHSVPERHCSPTWSAAHQVQAGQCFQRGALAEVWE